jgi:polyhydroxybutyrate depolymerase
MHLPRLRTTRRARRMSLAVVAVALVAACGGADGTDAATTTTEPPAEYPESVDPVASDGCGTSRVGVLQRERRTLDVAGAERWYLLSTPSAHDGRTPLPLVVELHGLAQGAENAAATGLVDDLGEREGYVSVLPQGTGEPVQWDQRFGAGDNADFDFVEELLDTLGRELCLDEARVYATGLSYGAIMSSALACGMSERFAAIAPVAGVEHPDGCDPPRPVPVLAFHGTADPILLFNGGVGDLGAALAGRSPELPDEPVDLDGEGYPAAVAAWAAANGCGDAADERRSPQVLERTYDCPAEGEVRFLVVEGGGHSWPGSTAQEAIESIVGPTIDEVDATEENWAFFRRHALPDRQEVGATGGGG